MAYVIVNAFLNNVTFQSTEAETWIKRAILNTGEGIRPDMLDNIDEVFRPIFFYYPNGLDDRTRGEPRNPSQCIRQWRDITTWRDSGDIVAAPRHATEQLAKHQVAVETWSPRTHVEARICPGDGIEVDWKQPDAEGGFWAWGLVHPASGAPKWGYFPLSCIPPPSHAKMVFVEEHHV